MSTVINPMIDTVLFIAQEKVPPVHEAIIWNGTVACMQALAARYHVDGYIDKDSSLILHKRETTNYRDRVQLGEYLIFVWKDGVPTFINILQGAEFIKKFSAHPNGRLDIAGAVKL